MNADISLLYTTCADEKAAHLLAERAIHAGYAACVNVIPGVISYYEWQGKLEKSQELVLIFKTTQVGLNALYEWIKTQHPYSVPAILMGNVETSPEFYAYVNGLIRAL